MKPYIRISILAAITFCAPHLRADKPVKVYILAGQSNMVGIGQVSSNGVRWGDEFQDPVLSTYEGEYDPKVDYDALKPLQTLKLASFGGTEPTEYPKGGLRIVRGQILPKTTGVYQFNPGHGDSENNIMMINGVETHRQEPGKEAVKKPVKLTAGEKVSFRITYLTEGANGLGWTVRLDIPGTLNTLVREEGKFSYLIDKEGKWVSRDDVWYKGVVTATGNKWAWPRAAVTKDATAPACKLPKPNSPSMVTRANIPNSRAM